MPDRAGERVARRARASDERVAARAKDVPTLFKDQVIVTPETVWSCMPVRTWSMDAWVDPGITGREWRRGHEHSIARTTVLQIETAGSQCPPAPLLERRRTPRDAAAQLNWIHKG